MRPGLSVRGAVAAVRRRTPDACLAETGAWSTHDIAADFAARFAGVPATSAQRPEPVVRYPVDGSRMPVLLGLYGSEERVHGWLPGLPDSSTVDSVAKLLSNVVSPERVANPPCQQVVRRRVDLRTLPALQTTARDAGPYLTLGMVHAREADRTALSVHRMLVLDETHIALWMVPGRALRAMHESAGRLPVSVSIGAPPAAVLASALSTAVLPAGVGKLDVAGALAGGPVGIAAGVSQPVDVLAESEIVLEGYLDGTVADETLNGSLGVSLPEFLGYDGSALPDLPVLTVTAVTTRRNPMYQAVIGPGREQSVILGLAGALSVALTGDDEDWRMIADLHFAAAGGGMLLLNVAVRKDSARADGRLRHIARRIFERHTFVKLIVFTDPDVDIRSAEDVWWAVTTRANLGVDCGTLPSPRRLTMDPSQGPGWRGDGGTGRTFVDATVPYRLRDRTMRSFR
ncbi:UbiD family decarboxylase [Actinocrispum sp. NPDC049592]|uniref:UbiD family decarboxylase n=1 Tax=Actinocrispum sp. NPDC049592 TaxID=3154835 RepID=UPI00341853A9